MGIACDAGCSGVVELAHIPDIFASGITPIETRGDFVRITLYSERRIDREGFDESGVERVVVAHIVFTTDGFQRALRIAMRAIQELPEAAALMIRLS